MHSIDDSTGTVLQQFSHQHVTCFMCANDHCRRDLKRILAVGVG